MGDAMQIDSVRAMPAFEFRVDGTAPIELRWNSGDGHAVRFRSRTLTVAVSPVVLTDLRALLGADRVRLVRADG